MNLQATSNDQRVSVRFPDTLQTALKKAAQLNGRSFNTEVITRLSESVSAEKAGTKKRRK